MTSDEKALRARLEDRRAMFLELMRDIGDAGAQAAVFVEVARLVGIITFWLSFAEMPSKMIVDVSRSLEQITPIKVVTP